MPHGVSFLKKIDEPLVSDHAGRLERPTSQRNVHQPYLILLRYRICLIELLGHYRENFRQINLGNESLHGLPPVEKTIGDFPGQSTFKNCASDVILTLPNDIGYVLGRFRHVERKLGS
jgi:hypothetical protein